MHVRYNNTYDVKYDTGDEVRFVSPEQIRLPAEKKPYAYRVEMGLVLLLLSFPVCLLLSVTGSPGLICLGLLIVSSLLLVLRLVLFVQYAINYSRAGLCHIAQLTLLFSLPLLMLLIAAVSAVGSAGPVKWISVVVLLIVAKVLSLVPLSMMRPTYAVIGKLNCVPILSISISFLFEL